jgi:hypothetical protein
MKKSLAALALLAAVGCAAQAGDRIALGPLAPGMSLAEITRVFPGAALKCLEVQGKTVCGYSLAAENVQVPSSASRALSASDTARRSRRATTSGAYACAWPGTAATRRWP